MQTRNWPDFTRGLSAELRNLRGSAPEVMKAFAALAQSGLTEGALDGKTKELIAIAVSIAARVTIASAFTTRRRSIVRAREEILETLGMAIYMGAGPAAMYASHALAPIRNSRPPRPTPRDLGEQDVVQHVFTLRAGV